MEREHMLTTIDNPYDPFDQFILWFMFDVEKGYDTCGKLARFITLSDEMSQKEKDEEIERAIDTIIAEDFTNTFIRVYEGQMREQKEG